MQLRYPTAQFVVYDLGLLEPQREAQLWCNVRYVRFEFEKYPVHVRNLQTYAWKPVIIAEQLNALGFFFWMDASPRLACSDLSVFPSAVLNRSVEPFFTYAHAGHSIFSATHPGMVEYFPVDDVRYLQVTEMKGATGIFVSDSAYTRELLKWTVLCSLTEDCIAPKGSQVTCKFGHRYNDYANCHRYDQSAMALVRLHLLYLDGYYNQLKGSDRLCKPSSPEALRNLSLKWETQFEPFESCFSIKGGDYYDGVIPLCYTKQPEGSVQF